MRKSLGMFVIGLAACSGCTQDALVAETLSGSATDGTPGATDTGGPSDSTSDPTTGEPPPDDDSDPSVGTFDLGDQPDIGGMPDVCSVADDIDGIGDCLDDPLSESFEADVQWSWDGGPGGESSLATPLVANLTDDNGDGAIDLCDTPDIVVLTSNVNGPGGTGRIIVFDGDSSEGGDIHWESEDIYGAIFNHALGDIDDDGIPEIVAVLGGPTNGPHAVAVLEHDGTPKWETPPYDQIGAFGHIALADLDADGDVEIMADGVVLDHEGNLVFMTAETLHTAGSSGFAVDLDGDDDLEFVHSRGAHHHDGSVYFSHPEESSLSFPSVADIDDDGEPEIIFSQWGEVGLTIYEHDGTMSAQGVLPTLTGIPAALHDMDGDGSVDLAVGNGSYETPNYGVINFIGGVASSSWSVDVEGGCCAGSTAFDFLGDGTAEAMFADDTQLYIFDELGASLTTSPRLSGTGTDYPVVADVDNDGSAEIVVVAANPDAAPTVQVVRDMSEGWVQARRIWNQHAYHVTNVREDGTIPAVQPKNWKTLNTFRTQAQIDDDGVCDPPPAG